MEAIRNSYDLLRSHFCAIISQHLDSCESVPHGPGVYHFWVCMGILPDIAETMADLRLRWNGTAMQLHERRKGRVAWIEYISFVNLSVFKFRTFTDSRWTTIGECCCSWLTATNLGLEGLVVMTPRDPEASDSYLHGFGTLTADVRKYPTMANLVAKIPNAGLLLFLGTTA